MDAKNTGVGSYDFLFRAELYLDEVGDSAPFVPDIF